MRILLFVAALLAPCGALAAVDHIDILSRRPLAGGKSYGAAGPYELVRGRVYFSVNPTDPCNARVVDLARASVHGPKAAVTFSSDLYLIRPIDGSRGNHTLFVEISNRGGRGLLPAFDGAAVNSAPENPNVAGDGWLLNQGYTLCWVGWQWDIVPRTGAPALYAPVAYDPGHASITGMIRDDFALPLERDVVPLGHIISSRIGGLEYPVSDPADLANTLTYRDGPLAPRVPIPRSEWRFIDGGHDLLSPDSLGPRPAATMAISLNGGFKPGRIYELVYAVKDPVVAGLGFVAVRDLVSYLKGGPRPEAAVDHAIGMGVSQTGRFLRDFVYQGFNADEGGKRVFDGLLIHVAGAGRGSFNQRFAQPSRDAQAIAAIDYPTDLFPFTDLPETDPATGQRAGLLDAASAAGVVPKIFYSNTSHEYWGRAASLIHTSPDGSTDAPIPATSRIYYFTGLQHYTSPLPPAYGSADTAGQNRINPLQHRWLLRAELTSLEQWVRSDVEPPPSNYPKISDGTLVPVARLAFPALPGIAVPKFTAVGWHQDYGPRWDEGIPDNAIPLRGKSFPVSVPQVDADGNERAGIRQPEYFAPLATYTGWNLRDPKLGEPDQRAAFIGSYIPFCRTPDSRRVSGDPRRSLAERYPDEAAYLSAYRAAALAQVKARWLLASDVDAVVAFGREEWLAAQSLDGPARAAPSGQ